MLVNYCWFWSATLSIVSFICLLVATAASLSFGFQTWDFYSSMASTVSLLQLLIPLDLVSRLGMFSGSNSRCLASALSSGILRAWRLLKTSEECIRNWWLDISLQLFSASLYTAFSNFFVPPTSDFVFFLDLYFLSFLGSYFPTLLCSLVI